MLVVSLNDRVVDRIATNDAKETSLPGIKFIQGDRLLFEEEGGVRHLHPLDFEQGYLHLCVRILPNRLCMIDAAVTQKPVYNNDFDSKTDTGIRFQPFALKGCEIVQEKGKGMFDRGFHFAGNVTPGWVSLACICDHCGHGFRLRSFHAGFSQVNYFYSDSGLETLTVSEYEPGCPGVRSEKIDRQGLADLEKKFPKAPDGSNYSYMNALRCPACAAPFIDFGSDLSMRAREYYGNVHMGRRAIPYRA